jgi:transposase
MTMSGDDVLTKPVARRMEVFTGAGRRRKWSAEAKAKIVAESYAASVGEVADRYGLAKNQLFTWRREARTKAATEPGTPPFVPVIVEPAPAPASAALHPKRLRRWRRAGEGGIELEISGVTVRVERGADANTVAAVIRALKAEA